MQLLLLCAASILPGNALAADKPVVPLRGEGGVVTFVPTPGFNLWQLGSVVQDGAPSSIPRQQINSYVIQTSRGKLIVVDGGMRADAVALRTFLGTLGSNVDMWFISHQHPDHIGALTEILESNSGPTISGIYASLLALTAIHDYEVISETEATELSDAIQLRGVPLIDLTIGQKIAIDKVMIEIIGVRNTSVLTNFINNSSVVMKVSGGGRSVLFTGDIDALGAQQIINRGQGGKLRADYVQMAHHGSYGGSQEFYELIGAQHCMWPDTLHIRCDQLPGITTTSSTTREWVSGQCNYNYYNHDSDGAPQLIAEGGRSLALAPQECSGL